MVKLCWSICGSQTALYTRCTNLVESFVAKSTELHQVGEAEDTILDDKAEQLRKWFQKTLSRGKAEGWDYSLSTNIAF